MVFLCEFSFFEMVEVNEIQYFSITGNMVGRTEAI